MECFQGCVGPGQRGSKRSMVNAFLVGLSQEALSTTTRFMGTFFSNLDELWEPEATPVAHDWYGAAVRNPIQGRVLYLETVNNSILEYPMAPTASSSDATNANQTTT